MFRYLFNTSVCAGSSFKIKTKSTNRLCILLQALYRGRVTGKHRRSHKNNLMFYAKFDWKTTIFVIHKLRDNSLQQKVRVRIIDVHCMPNDLELYFEKNASIKERTGQKLCKSIFKRKSPQFRQRNNCRTCKCSLYQC